MSFRFIGWSATAGLLGLAVCNLMLQHLSAPAGAMAAEPALAQGTRLAAEDASSRRLQRELMSAASFDRWLFEAGGLARAGMTVSAAGLGESLDSAEQTFRTNDAFQLDTGSSPAQRNRLGQHRAAPPEPGLLRPR